ncbi:AAA family ATPase [Natrialba sp. SSL1]|uniref:AAA family ATPase n=1 Tax=Natrialba sp. SSL1 TaxID=1869245 RepID=UPI0008F86D98|nr:AAA family ATPase [Natrialba sp. SSL1]OIB55294.1 kinase [Natrialba sp. SSL1]
MHRATLIVYCGLPGVGKSAASGYTAEQIDAERYRTDQVRKQLFPDPSYTPEETHATYDALLERARSTLESGSNVVLDATFQSRPHREQAAAMADETGVDCEFVYVDCDLDVVEERIEERTDTISDAQFEQHLQLRETFDSIERDHVVVDNSGTLEETYRQIDEHVL